MRIFLTLVKRELTAFFLSPMAYVFLVCFLLMEGWYFNALADVFAQHPDSQGILFSQFMWGFTLFYLLIIIPCITMRLISEERRSGTMEVLMAAPLTDTQMVLAKYTGAVLFYILLWAPTLAYVALLSAYGNPDYWQIAGAYLGVILFGMVLLAMGLFCSAASQSQIAAAIMAIALNFGFFFLVIQKDMGTDWVRQELALGKWKVPVRDILQHIHFLEHGEAFTKGLVDLRPIVFDASVILFFLFAAVKVTESRRWRS